MDEIANITFDAIAALDRLVVAFAGHGPIVAISGQYFQHHGKLLLARLNFNELVRTGLVKLEKLKAKQNGFLLPVFFI